MEPEKDLRALHIKAKKKCAGGTGDDKALVYNSEIFFFLASPQGLWILVLQSGIEPGPQQ